MAFRAQAEMNGQFIYTQPRTLLAVLRMSQALARLRFSQEIEEADIREALRLMDEAKRSMVSVAAGKAGRRAMDPMDYIYQQIRRLRDERGAHQLSLDDIKDRLRVAGGFDDGQLAETIEKYEELSVWMRVGESIVFI
jgi:DNA replication licensing factor MCM7